MKIEIGKYYMNADGEKVGPMVGTMFKWVMGEDDSAIYPFEWTNEGKGSNGAPHLIAEWSEEPQQKSPIRTVTRKEIVPGVYGNIVITSSVNDFTMISMVDHPMTSGELTAAIATLTEIRDSLDY